MSDKPRFPAAAAKEVARELVRDLQPNCDRLIVAGSLRRRKAEVGDVEIVFVPLHGTTKDPNDFFGIPLAVNFAEAVIEKWLLDGVLVKRPNTKGRTAWGGLNKFAIHVASGIPVDLFAATPENWGNYVVCRTGGEAMNKAICNAAIDRGWHWNPYGEGFSRQKALGREVRPMRSEREVFEFAGLDYLEPWERP